MTCCLFNLWCICGCYDLIRICIVFLSLFIHWCEFCHIKKQIPVDHLTLAIHRCQINCFFSPEVTVLMTFKPETLINSSCKYKVCYLQKKKKHDENMRTVMEVNPDTHSCLIATSYWGKKSITLYVNDVNDVHCNLKVQIPPRMHRLLD